MTTSSTTSGGPLRSLHKTECRSCCCHRTEHGPMENRLFAPSLGRGFPGLQWRTMRVPGALALPLNVPTRPYRPLICCSKIGNSPLKGCLLCHAPTRGLRWQPD